MHRRQFISLTSGATAAVILGSCIGRSSYAVALSSQREGAIDAKKFHAMRKFAETSFGRIAYVERGVGRVALLLHGFPLNGFQWRGALERLSRYRRCIAPDWLGLGYTEVTEGQGVTPADQATMLATFMDTLSIPKADLVANDSGGAVAQLFVTHHPERVRTLLLTNCDAEFDSPPPKVVPVIEAARSGRFADTLRQQLADKNLARSADGIGGLCYAYPNHPTDEAVDVYFAPLVSSQRRNALTNGYALGLDPNPLAGIESSLRRCMIPTRIVWGVADSIFSPETPAYLDRILPKSLGVRRIPKAKLFFPEEYPDVTAGEARRLGRADG
jgi:haloalkane dehalogenase